MQVVRESGSDGGKALCELLLADAQAANARPPAAAAAAAAALIAEHPFVAKLCHRLRGPLSAISKRGGPLPAGLATAHDLCAVLVGMISAAVAAETPLLLQQTARWAATKLLGEEEGDVGATVFGALLIPHDPHATAALAEVVTGVLSRSEGGVDVATNSVLRLVGALCCRPGAHHSLLQAGVVGTCSRLLRYPKARPNAALAIQICLDMYLKVQPVLLPDIGSVFDRDVARRMATDGLSADPATDGTAGWIETSTEFLHQLGCDLPGGADVLQGALPPLLESVDGVVALGAMSPWRSEEYVHDMVSIIHVALASIDGFPTTLERHAALPNLAKALADSLQLFSREDEHMRLCELIIAVFEALARSALMRAVVVANAGAVLSRVSLSAKPGVGRKVDRLWAAIRLTEHT